MTTLTSLLGASTLLATTTKKSSSSELPFLLIIGVFALLYFFVLRPRQQKARAKTTKGKSFEIGDDVMSVGGIYGRIVALGDESVEVEVAPDVVLTFLRRAVNQRPVTVVSPDIEVQDRSDYFDESGHEFGASSGHFEASDDFDESGHFVDSGHFDDHDHDDAGEPDDTDDTEDADDSDDTEDAEDADDTEVVDPEADDSDNEPGPDVAGGSATGEPRTTGGSTSEEN